MSNIYAVCPGFVCPRYDKQNFSFWVFAEAMEYNLNNGYNGKLWYFGDYSYELNVFAIDFSKNQSIQLDADGIKFTCAKNLNNFFSKMSNNPHSLLMFDSDT